MTTRNMRFHPMKWSSKLRARWSLWFFWTVMITIVLLLASCSNEQSHDVVRSHLDQSASTINTSTYGKYATVDNATFSFSGGSQKSSPIYAFHTNTTLSKLRHGHREFTINLADADRSLIIAFIGYSGPASYTLSNHVNGGDVRISVGKQYWDLSLVPTASCSLTVLSDAPTEQPGLDRMQGRFICPMLPSGGPDKSTYPVAVNNGTFDVSIIVES